MSGGPVSTGASSTPSLARWERVKESQLVSVISRPYTLSTVPMLRSVQCQYSLSAPWKRKSKFTLVHHRCTVHVQDPGKDMEILRSLIIILLFIQYVITLVLKP